MLKRSLCKLAMLSFTAMLFACVTQDAGSDTAATAISETASPLQSTSPADKTVGWPTCIGSDGSECFCAPGSVCFAVEDGCACGFLDSQD